MNWFTRNTTRRPTAARLQLESLEDRVVPSGTPLDLTTKDSSGEIGDAIFAQATIKPAGTGNLKPFLTIHGHGKDGRIEEGYNTDARPLEFDEKQGQKRTRSLNLSDVGTVNIGGTEYREFLLDVNEPGSKTKSLISLDELRIYLSDQKDLTGYDPDTFQLDGVDPIYDLDSESDNFILINGKLGQGSGKSDLLVYIKDSLFSEGDGSQVYLYSKFGEEEAAEGGFEEWAARATPFTQGLGSISGTVFDDTDSDGTLDSGETGMVNVSVFLDTNDNNLLDDGEVFTTTETDGSYSFTGLVTGLGSLSTYVVRQVVPTGFEQTSDDPDPIVLTLDGEAVLDVNFGNALTP